MRPRSSLLRLATLAIATSVVIGGAQPAQAAATTIQAQGAIAPPLIFSNPVGLDFGLLAYITPGSPASYQVPAAGGAATATNVTQLTAESRGSIDLTGRSGNSVSIVIVPGALACLTSCFGTPDVINPTHTFTGTISNASCVGIRCTERIYVGATFDMPLGTEEGEWSGTMTITANYN